MSLSCEAASSAATQELPSILWNPKIHYRVHKSPPLVPILDGNEPSGSIKCWEFLEWLHNWQLLKKGSAPWVKCNLVSLKLSWRVQCFDAENASVICDVYIYICMYMYISGDDVRFTLFWYTSPHKQHIDDVNWNFPLSSLFIILCATA
jgi:hypothetical protein